MINETIKAHIYRLFELYSLKYLVIDRAKEHVCVVSHFCETNLLEKNIKLGNKIILKREITHKQVHGVNFFHVNVVFLGGFGHSCAFFEHGKFFCGKYSLNIASFVGIDENLFHF